MNAVRRRRTRQRAAVRAALEEGGEFRSAQELFTQLRERGEGIGLATVYRALQNLAEDREVDVLHGVDGESLYRRCTSAGQHHHLVCRSCRRTVEVSSQVVDRWAGRVARDNNYTDVEHVTEVFGTCEECRRTELPERRAELPENGRAAPRR
ncbi:MAG: Fur family transcriptional regulator, ferric uptake regulator [Actinomycetota bacterium]|nr:Fur family transcriptional regulator, ferric uptake regulator [Actinomycetota bacterium]